MTLVLVWRCCVFRFVYRCIYTEGHWYLSSACPLLYLPSFVPIHIPVFLPHSINSIWSVLRWTHYELAYMAGSCVHVCMCIAVSVYRSPLEHSAASTSVGGECMFSITSWRALGNNHNMSQHEHCSYEWPFRATCRRRHTGDVVEHVLH